MSEQHVGELSPLQKFSDDLGEYRMLYPECVEPHERLLIDEVHFTHADPRAGGSRATITYFSTSSNLKPTLNVDYDSDPTISRMQLRFMKTRGYTFEVFNKDGRAIESRLATDHDCVQMLGHLSYMEPVRPSESIKRQVQRSHVIELFRRLRRERR